MRKNLTYVLVMLTMFSLTTFAEDFRVWSGNNGSTTEAKFIQMSGPKVILEKRDGKRITVPKKALCKADQEYLAAAIPPELKITVDKDVDSDNVSQGYYYTRKRESIDIEVKIEKVNKDKCTRKFKASLYIMAKSKDGDRRKVLRHEDHSFSFVDSDSTSFSGSAEVTNSEGYSYEYGFEYEGYLIVVEDDNGSVIAIDTNKSTYETHLEKIRKNIDKNDFKL